MDLQAITTCAIVALMTTACMGLDPDDLPIPSSSDGPPLTTGLSMSSTSIATGGDTDGETTGLESTGGEEMPPCPALAECLLSLYGDEECDKCAADCAGAESFACMGTVQQFCRDGDVTPCECAVDVLCPALGVACGMCKG